MIKEWRDGVSTAARRIVEWTGSATAATVSLLLVVACAVIAPIADLSDGWRVALAVCVAVSFVIVFLVASRLAAMRVPSDRKYRSRDYRAGQCSAQRRRVETYYEAGQWRSRVPGEAEPFARGGTKDEQIARGTAEARRRKAEHVIKNQDAQIVRRNSDPRQRWTTQWPPQDKR